jgi:CAAX prenyl protease-like protein
MSRNPTLGYVAPFVAYIAFLVVPLPPEWMFPVRFVLVAALILLFSRPYLSLRTSAALASIAIGVAVFAIWIGPDLLFHYRHHWLFENSILGKPASSLDPRLRQDAFFLTVRILSSVVLVPILEELFWRGWLMRWLVDTDFLKVPLGAYNAKAFWIVAILFASEHGSYWEVGLLAGIVYNWWIVRTKTLADCILAHAVTNGALALYVLVAGQWQYWL